MGGAPAKVRRYRCYRLWAKCMRHRRTPFKKYDVFDFPDDLKEYLRYLTGGPVTDDPAPIRAIHVSAKMFVKYVIKHLDDAL